MKLRAYRKRFCAGGTDGLDMLLGMTTYIVTLSKEKCWQGYSWYEMDGVIA